MVVMSASLLTAETGKAFPSGLWGAAYFVYSIFDFWAIFAMVVLRCLRYVTAV